MADDSESAASKLRKALEGPVYNDVLRRDVGKGELDYEIYLRTQSLLSLQTRVDELCVPEELLFQVVHQAQELWLKLATFEASVVLETLDKEHLFAACASLDRLVMIVRTLGAEIRILETLPPAAFQNIRRQLGNGSGLESPGYARMLVAAAAAATAHARILDRRQTTLIEIYSRPMDYPDLHRISEQFIDWDEAFQSWLMAHFLLVRRTIGIDKEVRALDGFPTRALAPRMMKPLFPNLWDVRVEMTKLWMREGGFAPGETRARRDGGFSASGPSSRRDSGFGTGDRPSRPSVEVQPTVRGDVRAYLPDEDIVSERGPNSARGPNSVRYWKK
jgi:tryptophan 2,3-dioxygenase